MPVTDAQKLAILDQHIDQFEVEMFQWELNRRTAVALGMATDTADAAINELATAIAIRREEKATLELGVDVVA